jgi:four helix bundle protein
MELSDWSFEQKPYDLRERLFNFGCAITRLAKFLHTQGPVGIAFADQVLRSGTSAGSNYEEADDGSSARDRRAKRQIVLRELKETSFRLRVLRQAEILTAAHDPVIAECAELVRIVAAVLRKSPRT